MGEVAPGSLQQATFTLTNPGTRTVELARIDSSCDCLTVDVPHRIAASEQVIGRVKVDLRDDPHFGGELAIEIKGWTSTGELASLVVVHVRVPHKNVK